ncbi:MAG TPA: glycine--tRNA ligase subunit alpha, partial [Deltaproteobacteria bacterium]|nr:glycine--tRNA ligase subunit alpha [Deltaproteobacteria bacterium]
TQFTYFQQVGGFDLDPVCTEITYGLERIAMYLQNRNSVYDITWKDDWTYGYVHHAGEVQWSRYNFELADVPMLLKLFTLFEEEGRRIAEKGLCLPVYDMCLKCSHIFNLLNARGAISTTERQSYVLRVRELARESARLYLEGIRARGEVA